MILTLILVLSCTHIIYWGLQKNSYTDYQVCLIIPIKRWLWRSWKKLVFPPFAFISFLFTFRQGMLGCYSRISYSCNYYTLRSVLSYTFNVCWTSSSMFRLQVADVHHFIVVFDRSFTGIERRPLVSAEPELLGWLIFLWSDVRPSPDIMFDASGVWWFWNTGPITNWSAWSNLAFGISLFFLEDSIFNWNQSCIFFERTHLFCFHGGFKQCLWSRVLHQVDVRPSCNYYIFPPPKWRFIRISLRKCDDPFGYWQPGRFQGSIGSLLNYQPASFTDELEGWSKWVKIPFYQVAALPGRWRGSCLEEEIHNIHIGKNHAKISYYTFGGSLLGHLLTRIKLLDSSRTTSSWGRLKIPMAARRRALSPNPSWLRQRSAYWPSVWGQYLSSWLVSGAWCWQ